LLLHAKCADPTHNHLQPVQQLSEKNRPFSPNEEGKPRKSELCTLLSNHCTS